MVFAACVLFPSHAFFRFFSRRLSVRGALFCSPFAFFQKFFVFLIFPLAFFPHLVYYIPVAPLECADIAQPVERILGKDEVPSSNLGISSR